MAKQKELDKKKVADQLRAGVQRLNNLLDNAREAGLSVSIYKKSESKLKINEYSELVVEDIHSETKF